MSTASNVAHTLRASELVRMLTEIIGDFGDLPVLCGGKARAISEDTVFALRDYGDSTKYNIHIEGV